LSYIKHFSYVFISFVFALKAKFPVLKFEFCQIPSGYRTSDKLAINWQNLSQIGLQLKFAFRIPPLEW